MFSIHSFNFSNSRSCSCLSKHFFIFALAILLNANVQAAIITAEVTEADNNILVSNSKQDKATLAAGTQLFGENKIVVPEKASLILKLNTYIELSASNSQFAINRLSSNKKFLVFPDYGSYILKVKQASQKSLRNLPSSIQLKISNIIITVTSGVIALEFQGNTLKVVSINSNSAYSIITEGEKISTNKLENLTWLEFDTFKSVKTHEGVMTSLSDTKNKLALLNLTAKQLSYFNKWTSPEEQTEEDSDETVSTDKTNIIKPATNTTVLSNIQTNTEVKAAPQPAYLCLINQTGLKLTSASLRCTAATVPTTIDTNSSEYGPALPASVTNICGRDIKEDLNECTKKLAESNSSAKTTAEQKTENSTTTTPPVPTPVIAKGFYLADPKGTYCLDLNNQGACMNIDLKDVKTIDLGAVKFDTQDSVMVNINSSYVNTKSELILIPGTYSFRFKKIVKDPETGEEGSLIREKKIDIVAGKLQTISN